MQTDTKKQSPVKGRKAKQKNVTYPGIFDETWSDPKPLLKLFRTSLGGYIYDTGTNKIFSCRDEVFDLVRELMMTDTPKAAENFIARHGEKAFLDAAEEIADAMKEENVFKVKRGDPVRVVRPFPGH